MFRFFRFFLAFYLLLTNLLLFAQNFWEPLSQISGVSANQIAIATNGDVYMTSGTTLYRSEDKGDTWTSVLTNSNGIEDLKAGPFDNNVYYKSNAVLYRYIPQFGAFSIKSSTFYFDIAPNGDIYTYSGGGVVARRNSVTGEWANLFSQSDDPYGLAVFGNNRNFYWTDDLGMYRFSDDGSSRKLVLSGPKSKDHTLAESADQRLWFTTGGGLRVSINNGDNWTPYNNSAFQGVLVYGIYNSPGGEQLYAVSSKGLWRSEDNGGSWVLLFPFPLFNSQWYHGLSGLEFGNDSLMFIFDGICDKQFFLRSLDDGQSWEALDDRFTAAKSVKVEKDELGNLYALSCGGRLSKSADEGFSWELLPITDPFSDIEDIHGSPNGYVYAVDDSVVYRTNDAGLNWASFLSPIFAPAPVPERYLLQSSNDGKLFCYNQLENYRVYCSLDSGASWLGTNGNAFVRHWLHQHPDGTLFLNTYNNSNVSISSSIDGLDWTPMVFSSAFTRPQIVRILPDGTIYFTAKNSAGYQLYRTDTKFADWKITGGTVSNNYQAMVIDNNHVMYRMESNTPAVRRSLNDGFSWSSSLVNTGLGNAPGSDYYPTLFLTPDQYLYFCSTAPLPVFRTTAPVADYENLSGSIHRDTNPDCLPEPGERRLKNWIVRAEQGAQVYYSSVYPDYRYHINVPAPGQYSVSALPPHAMWSVCADPLATDLINTADRDTLDFAADAVLDCPYLEIRVGTPVLRRCFDNRCTVQFCNRGTADAPAGMIRVVLDSLATYLGASIPLNFQNGNELWFDTEALEAGECGTFQLYFNLSCDAVLGQGHCMDASILPVDPCVAGYDTLYTYRECRNNTGSYDPNNIVAFINGVQRDVDSIYTFEEEILYQINFQNTGTDTAFRVMLVDTLPALVIPESIVPGISSHPYQFELKTDIRTGRHFVRFLFNPIRLPDSTTNELESHGFVQFNIRRQGDIMPGMTIANKAAIYFDYNSPVVTNTKLLTLTDISSTSYENGAGASDVVAIYPNPAGTHAFLKSEQPMQRVAVIDALGRLIREYQPVENYWELPVDFASGIYWIVIQTDRARVTKRLVVN